MTVKDDLIALQKALFDFSKRNPFVHVLEKNLWSPANGLNDKLPEKLYKKSNYYWKEYGIETLLYVDVFIKWAVPNAQKDGLKVYYCSPLFYRPCSIKRSRKIETTYRVQLNDDEFAVNPVLRHYFKLFFDYQWPEKTTDVETEIQRFILAFNADLSTGKVKELTAFDKDECWQIIRKELVGNFNYKKSALGADYNQIIGNPSTQVKTLLSGESYLCKEEVVELKKISYLDQSQQQVIQSALNGNTVVQGPPGTGKSHTIVAMIGAFLAEDKKVLFVSEKRSALDVVNNRLVKIGLGDLIAYFNTNKDQKKAFFSGLKKTWLSLNEPKFDRVKVDRNVAHNNILHFYPDKLSLYHSSLNGSLQDLITILLQSNLSINNLKTIGQVPKYGAWQSQKVFLEQFESKILPAFNSQTVAACDFVHLNPAVFAETEVTLILEKRLNDLEETLSAIQAVQDEFDLHQSFDDFVRLALTGSILNMVNKVQLDLLNVDSKYYKSFNTWAKKYQLLKTKIAHAELGNKKWIKKPSLSEIKELIDLLKHADRAKKGSLFKILRRNPSRLKEAFSDFHPGISIHTKLELLEAVQLEWRLKGELDEVKVKLRHNLNITDPDNEIDLIFNLRNKLDAVSQNDYLQILEHPKSGALIERLSDMHPDLLKFNAQNRFLFQVSKIESLTEFANNIAVLKEKLPLINHWLPELKRFFQISPIIRHFIQQNAFKIDQLDAMVAYGNLLEETRFENDFKSLSGWEIRKVIQSKIKNDELEFRDNRSAIVDLARAKQSEAEMRVAKASFKLNEDQKKQKKQYKAERRVILHEINKQKQHLSVKTFFETTQNHLLKMQPVWMMNPLTVSENLPCVAELFDVVIFDESSQIPLEDAIPAIHRAKQVIIVGDSKQMPPSSFFSSQSATKTILDQGEQAFHNEMLKWHYRSQHPDLIRFSNLEFYNGNLLTLPPKSAHNPIEVKFVEGNYANGKNESEAAELADYCLNLKSNKTKSILIIAFSQEQEKEILRHLQKVNLHLSENIITKNLENAQGIEADIVLISFGYGKNEKGEFRLNFGPVNQLNGANRLNVMFTRAIEKMVLFTSVHSTDFGLSDNKGVQVLKDFLSFAEELGRLKPPVVSMPLAHQLISDLLSKNGTNCSYYPAVNGVGLCSFIQHSSNRILLVDPGIVDGEVTDIASVLGLISKQYEAYKVVLSMDLWLNRNRVEEDVITFFKQ